MQYYDEDVTFYMPAEFTDAGTGFDVTLNRIEVTGVVGIPYGLSFQSSSSNNNFYPSSNPPATEHGCAKFCGTPLVPGDYVIIVYVKAYVTVLGLNQTQDDSFEIPITILPASGGNSSFTYTNPSGCSPVITTFSPVHQSQGNPAYSYNWDFGNGSTSTLEFPPAQTYTNPGDYTVSLSTTIDTLGYFLSSITVSGSASTCDDIFDGPDYFIKLFEGSTKIYESSNVTNQTSATFSFPTITLNNVIYNIEVWDNDDFMGGGATGDDWCATVSFLGHTAGYVQLTNSALTVSFTIDHPILNFADTDTISVYPNPVFNGFIVTPNDTACSGDSIQLSSSGAYYWQWYHDTTAVVGAEDSVMTAHASGNYYVTLMNDFGCSTVSDTVNLAFLNNPPQPTFWQTGNILETMMSGYNLQWYFDDTAIPGATQQTLTITQSGYYTLEASNNFGCSTMSQAYYANYTEIAEFDSNGYKYLSVYPNPADELVNISFEAADPGLLNICITDITGKVVFTQDEYISSGGNKFSLDISGLAGGLYLIRLSSEQGVTGIRLVAE
jgi:PKD repeat protein